MLNCFQTQENIIISIKNFLNEFTREIFLPSENPLWVFDKNWFWNQKYEFRCVAGRRALAWWPDTRGSYSLQKGPSLEDSVE